VIVIAGRPQQAVHDGGVTVSRLAGLFVAVLSSGISELSMLFYILCALSVLAVIQNCTICRHKKTKIVNEQKTCHTSCNLKKV